MSRSIAKIRAARNQIIEDRKHKHVRKTFTAKEWAAAPNIAKLCGWVVLGKNGEPRTNVTICYDPYVDEEWFDDVGVLLAKIDDLKETIQAYKDNA